MIRRAIDNNLFRKTGASPSTPRETPKESSSRGQGASVLREQLDACKGESDRGDGSFVMSYPGTPIIRVGHMASRLPYPVNLHLPPTQGPDNRTIIRTIGPNLDIAVPQFSDRHEKLGRFMEAWSSLESTLDMLLSRITEIELQDAVLIIPKLGTKNALDLINGLAMRRLDAVSANPVMGFTDRISRINTKRNILVHGHWVLEANVFVRRGDAILITQYLRETTPTDPEDANRMANPRNQRERVRYCFTLKRIDGVTRDTEKLNREICEFMQTIRHKTLPLAEIFQRLWSSKPYQVSY